MKMWLRVNEKKGQAMLITVLALSGTVLGATTIAGLLMLYQIRQSTDVADSAKAVFAADTGSDWRLYSFFKVDDQKCSGCSCPGGKSCDSSNYCTLDNGSKFLATCTESGGVTLKSIGESHGTYRAFEVSLIASSP